MAEWDMHCRKMEEARSLGVLPNIMDEDLCHLKKGRFSRTCFGMRVIRARSTGLEPR
jgi:hypothetical protein